MLFFAIFQAILQDRKGAGWPNLLLLKPRGQHKMADIHTPVVAQLQIISIKKK